MRFPNDSEWSVAQFVLSFGRTVTVGLGLTVLAVGVTGCSQESAKAHESAKSAAPKAPLPEIFAALPIQEVVTEYEEVTGRTWATETIDVRARVSGYLDKVYFQDGAQVNPGDVLFEIDPRPFQVELARARAGVDQAQAHMDRLVSQEARLKKLLPSKTVTLDEYESVVFELAESKAALASAKAAEELADLNLSYTRVTSRIKGKIGRRLVDVGNLVKADDTSLATVVSQDPIHAYFDIDERTVLRLRRMMKDGKVQSPQDVALEADVALADDPKFSLKGTINFVDNQLDGSTGTLRARADIPNEHGFLSPGLFVRLRVPIGQPHEALMVREEALGSDQGQRFIYVLEKETDKESGEVFDVVRYRRVQIGMLSEGKRVIEEGLKPGERVIVTGLQRVRPGVRVAVRMVDKDGKLIDQPAAKDEQVAEAPPAKH